MLESFARKIMGLGELALAVSGGADSICMTLLCHQLKIKPKVLIVDHRLREESFEEAMSVKHYIEEKFNFEVYILTWNRSYAVSSNVQSKARDARYDLLISKCKELRINKLLTAHNQNDQAETVLLNIMRGTGIDGLVGIREYSIRSGVDIIRPMLSFSRYDIEKYLEAHSISWVNDPSNESDKYERVKVRKLLKKVSDSDLVNSEHFISRLNLLATNAARTCNFIDKYIEEKIKNIVKFWHLNVATVDIDQLMIEEEEVILRIIRKLLKVVGQHKNYVRGDSLLKLYENLKKDNKNFSATLGGCIIWTEYNCNGKNLVLCKEGGKKPNRVSKNEVRSLKAVFDGLESKYIIYDSYSYLKAKKTIESISKRYKILSQIEYEISNGKMLYKALGIMEMLSKI
jgi:tRNA(Ile)-lysidine synthase